MVMALTLIVSIFCMSVAAEDNTDDIAALLSGTPAVSGCDLKQDDLTMVKVKTTDFKMLVPTGKDNDKGELITIETSPDDLSKSEFAKAGYSRSTLIDGNIFLYFNTDNDNYCQVYAGLITLSPLDSFYGDYSNLTQELKDEILAQEVSADDPSTTGSFEKINGRTYLLTSKTESDEAGGKFVTYGLYTIIGEYKYIVQVVANNPTSQDLNVINEMLNSIKIGGLSEPMTTLDVTLIVCVVVLLIAAAFAIFMIYRLGQYIKAGTVPGSVFGFDIPDVAVTDEDDASDDEDDDTDDDDQSDETDNKVTLAKNESILG